ncbi:MAG: glycosyltransferase family 4 protein [Planctomycetes bacterium]|nr:glycosyltransferase family 4 protein [Planctomycetota bacterium]
MRILFFAHRYHPSIGGVEKYIHELARALLALGHEVSVLAGAHADGLPQHERHEGVVVHRFPAQRSPARCRLWLWRHAHLLRRADVVSVSNTHMLEYLWRMLGPLLDRRRLFLIRHGMGCVYPVPEEHRRRARRSCAWVAGTIHDGVFIEKWLAVRPELCPDQGLSPEADTLAPAAEPPPTSAVYIGRLEPDSGIRLYLDAVRRLTREHGLDFRLDVYGDGSLAEALRAEVRRDCLSVRFFGRVADAQTRIAHSCFAFLDGRMAIQEAMARRRLVVAGYVDPLKRDYVCGESFSPFLVPAGSGAEVAERTLYYSNHPAERAALVARAFEHARGLRWSTTAGSFLALWRERLAAPEPNIPLLRRLAISRALQREATRPPSPLANAHSRNCEKPGAARSGQRTPTSDRPIQPRPTADVAP